MMKRIYCPEASKMVNDITKKIHECIETKFAEGIGWRGSMDDFLCLFKNNPRLYMRTAVQYLSDMINHYGYEELKDCGETLHRHKIFDDCFGMGEAIYGQDRTLMKLVSQINTIAEGGGSERIILLKGPVASAKTTIVRQLIKGLEEYSKMPDGGVYTFNWVFPERKKDEKHVGFGFSEDSNDKSMKSYAHFKASEVPLVPCQLNDSPLLLYPPSQRKELLEKIIENSGIKAKIPKKLLRSELCYNCQTIYERLLEEYNGNISEVFKHIQVVRVDFSEIRKIGVATIQPVENMEGNAPLIAMDKDSYMQVVDMLKGIELHRFQGKWVDANRGLMHYSDMFKRHAQMLQYLLAAVQENIVDFNGGVQGYVDVVIIGTTNMSEIETVEKNQTNKGLLDRIRPVNIGYILQPKEESKIYEQQFNEGGYKTKAVRGDNHKHIYPHVVDMLATWSVMTRLLKPNQEKYSKSLDSETRQIIKDMSPLVKAKLYDGIIHETLARDAKIKLGNAKIQRLLRNEYIEEGLTGISPRLMQNTITDIISKKEAQESREGWNPNCLSIERIISGLEELMATKRADLVFELKNEKQDEFRNVYLLKEHIKDEYKRIISREVTKAVIGLSDDKRKAMIDSYLRNLFAFQNKTSLQNPETRTIEKPDISKMEYIENMLNCKSDSERKVFRESIAQEIGIIQLELQKERDGTDGNMLIGLDFIYDEIFGDIDDFLFEEQKQRLNMSSDTFRAAVQAYGKPKLNEFLPDQRTIISSMLEDLIANSGYCPMCVKNVVCDAVDQQLVKIGVEKNEMADKSKN
jgi:serine protein kinase